MRANMLINKQTQAAMFSDWPIPQITQNMDSLTTITRYTCQLQTMHKYNNKTAFRKQNVAWLFIDENQIIAVIIV